MNSITTSLIFTILVILIIWSRYYNRRPRAMFDNIKHVLKAQVKDFIIIPPKTYGVPTQNISIETNQGEFIRPLRFYFHSRHSMHENEIHQVLKKYLTYYSLVLSLNHVSQDTAVFEVKPRFSYDPHIYRVTISKNKTISFNARACTLFSISVAFKMIPQ